MGEYVIRPLLPVRSPTESLATFLVRLGEYFDLISNHERGIKPDTKLTNYILINASTGLNLIQKSLNDTRIWTLCIKSGLADYDLHVASACLCFTQTFLNVFHINNYSYSAIFHL